MIGKLATAAICIFWIIMMTLLVQREIAPAVVAFREEQHTPGFAHIKELAEKGYAEQMGIYLGQRRIGYAQAWLKPSPDDDTVRMINVSEISLNMPGGNMIPGLPGGAMSLKFDFNATVSNVGLQDFRLNVYSAGASAPLAIVDGNPVGDTLNLKIRTGDETRFEQVPFRADAIIGNDMGPMMLPAKIEPGVRWPVRSLDPMTYAVRTSWATVHKKETIEIEGAEVQAYLITIPFGNMELKVWANDEGQVLKQKFLGFSFIREALQMPEEQREPEIQHD